MKLARYLLPFGSPKAVIGETLFLPVMMVGLGMGINPQDPLWTAAGFPWAWLAPVILALRYGPFPGLAGAAMLLLSWFALSGMGWIGAGFPKLYFLGGLILVMLVGEFTSVLVGRTRRAESAQAYLDQRLAFLTHQYYLLRLSHDRLEQDLISRPMAMREALAALRELTGADEEARHSLPGADGLLRLLAQYCQLEKATIHAFAGGEPDPAPVASLGAGSRLDAADPMVRHALAEGALTHVAQGVPTGENPSRYVIVAPLRTVEGQLLGLLAVEQVPFFALHEEMLQTLNLLLGYYSDGLVMQSVAAPIRRAVPACPSEFAFELERLWRVRQDFGVKSIIVALEFDAQPEVEDLLLQIRRQKRSLDVTWLIETEKSRILVTLMPLAGTAAAEGYLARIDEWVQQQRSRSLDENGIVPHLLHLDEMPPVALLQRLFEISHVPDEARLLCPDA
ncbi:MAG TPA: PelD GGDEF domain-containing protein [Rhodocyclaceae bacterium]|nr:PelD GGDEF domain-containing protein [Rhodocyclaceae bacterium]